MFPLQPLKTPSLKMNLIIPSLTLPNPTQDSLNLAYQDHRGSNLDVTTDIVPTATLLLGPA